ncbi:MAG: phosphate transporter substrate-binding protein PstS family protein [Pseudomonadota bacterium]
MFKPVVRVLTLAIGFTSGMTVQAAVDPALPSYTKGAGVSGNLSSVGSDTLANLMTFWAEGFKKLYPNINMQIQAAGSSTAPPALAQGTANFGPMSRAMKDNEIQDFQKKYGYKPTPVPVAVDALAVFVHKDNPVKGLSMPLVDAMFSSTLKCGYPKNVTTWGEAGLTGAWAGRKLDLYGRNSVSGTYGYFKEHALCKGDFKSGVKEQPGSAAVVQAIATNINGVGYSGIGYSVSGTRAVPLKNSNGQFVAPSAKAALDGTYPLARYLYVYVNKAPGKALPPAQAEFLKMVLSKEGQMVVDKDGYIPLPAAQVKKIRASLGL